MKPTHLIGDATVMKTNCLIYRHSFLGEADGRILGKMKGEISIPDWLFVKLLTLLRTSGDSNLQLSK